MTFIQKIMLKRARKKADQKFMELIEDVSRTILNPSEESVDAWMQKSNKVMAKYTKLIV